MVIITAPAHQILIETLEKKGFTVLYSPDITYNELEIHIPEAEGLIVTTRIAIDRSILQKADKLKWIGRLGSGMELIDTDFAFSKNIICVSSPEGNRNSVGEQALGMLLSLLHNITKSSYEVKNFHWKREENRGSELSGKVIGIVGFGNTGEAFSKLLSGFNVTILAYDKYRSGFGGGYIKEASIDQVCRYADVISFHLPLTKDTQYFADNLFFSSLKRKPVILNTSRGGIINTDHLINALQDGLVSGAGLDVLENEKLGTLSDKEKAQMSLLLNNPAVIVTPHIAGYSYEAFYKMSEVLLQKLDL